MLELKQLVESMVTSIVDDVDNVRINETSSEKGVHFEVSVAKNDVGKLIGTGGRVANALRTIVKAAGAKRGVRLQFSVMNRPLDG